MAEEKLSSLEWNSRTVPYRTCFHKNIQQHFM